MQVFSILVIIGLLVKIYLTEVSIDKIKEKFIKMENKIELLIEENNLLQNENIKCKKILHEYNIKINHTKVPSRSGLYNEVFNDN